MLPTDYASLTTKKEIFALEKVVKEVCDRENVRYHVVGVKELENREPPVSFNLPSAMHHCCGTPAVTYESNQGLVDHGDVIYGYEEIYKAHMILFGETMRYYLKKFGKI